MIEAKGTCSFPDIQMLINPNFCKEHMEYRRDLFTAEEIEEMQEIDRDHVDIFNTITSNLLLAVQENVMSEDFAPVPAEEYGRSRQPSRKPVQRRNGKRVITNLIAKRRPNLVFLKLTVFIDAGRKENQCSY